MGILKGYDQLMNLVMDEVTEEFESESGVPQLFYLDAPGREQGDM